MWAENGLPASGERMLNLPRGDKQGEEVWERFHYLLLDSLEQDQETVAKGGLASAAIKRKRAVNQTDDDESAPVHPNNTPTKAIHVLLIDSDKPMDQVGGSGKFKWATAGTKQSMAFKELTITALMNAINAKKPPATCVSSIFSAVTKAPPNVAGPEIVERITCEEDFKNFIEVTRVAYMRILMQVQRNRTDPAAQRPLTNERRHFRNDEFPPMVREDPYNPLASDSEIELFLIKFWKNKQRHGRGATMGTRISKRNAANGLLT